MSILKFEFSVDTETGEFSVVNTETGEAKISKVKKSTTKRSSKKNKDMGPEPTLILEENKYILNDAAVELLGVQPDDKIDIKYEKQGKKMIPVIASDEVFETHKGNKLTKSNTVQFRGSKNEELAKFGTTFILVAHENKNGIFMLQNKDAELEEALDESVEKEELTEEMVDDLDVDIQSLIDDKDANVTEIDSTIFNFSL